MMSSIQMVALGFWVFGLDMLCYTSFAPLERKTHVAPLGLWDICVSRVL